MDTKQIRRQFRAASAITATLLAAGCGGSGSDDPSPPAMVTVSGKAVDGPLQGANACYDLNDNAACDSGEPVSAANSDADGHFTISVLEADAGKHRLIVNVPATAIDKDTGATVGTAFTMVAPATGTAGAQSVVVSPLTTLVQRQIDTTGQTLAEARDFIQAQAGLAVSPLADFTAVADADHRKAADVSALILRSAERQRTEVADAVGLADLSGGTVSQADVDQAVTTAVATALPAIGAASGDPALAATSGAARQLALTAAATVVVRQIGLTVPELVAEVGMRKLPAEAPSSSAPEAGASLAALQYTDASHWFVRTLQSSAADNTPDANGLLRYVDVRTRMRPYAFDPDKGVAQSFAFGTTIEASGDLHWNGSAWAACTLGTRNTSTPRDAQGRSNYNFCDGYDKGSSVRKSVDIGGKSLATVLTDTIRVFPGGNTGVLYKDWGPTDLSLLGSATFPAGSQVQYNTSTPLETAFAYDVRSSNQVQVFSAEVAAGGDGRTGSPACAGAALPSTAATTLEEMAARTPGQPCIFGLQTNADGNSTNPRYGWGLTSLSLGVLNGANALPAGTGNYYSSNARLRVTFAASGNGTTYHSCYERRVDGATQNCAVIGSGSYSITTLGDARVMSFANLPTQAQALTFTRVFIERGGKVYYGYKNQVGIEFKALRLNLPAANAFMDALGLPMIQPAESPAALTGAKAATAATLKGVWARFSDSGATVFRFGDNGAFVMAQAGAPEGGGRPGLEQGWLDVDLTTGKLGVLLAVDSNGEWGTSHTGPGASITGVTATQITTDGGDIPRFVDQPNGLVGLWSIAPDDLTVWSFMFLPNGKVLHVQPIGLPAGQACIDARLNPPGIEWSDYTFDATTGAVNWLNPTYDTNGCVGAFNLTGLGAPIANTSGVFTLAADGKSFTLLRPNGSIRTYFRVPTR